MSTEQSNFRAPYANSIKRSVSQFLQSPKYIRTNLPNLRMRGQDIGNGWIVHTLPQRNEKYYYHTDLKLVTMEDMTHPETRRTVLSTYRQQTDRNPALETFVDERKAHCVVDHNAQTFKRPASPASADESRSSYWIYLSNFPCHHNLQKHAEKDAMTMLQLMIVRKHISHKNHIHTSLFLDQRILPTRKVWLAHRSQCQTSSDTSISLPFPNHSRLPMMMYPVPKVLSSATSSPIFVRPSL